MHLEIKRECNKIAVVENIDNIHNSTKLSFDGAAVINQTYLKNTAALHSEEPHTCQYCYLCSNPSFTAGSR